MALHFVEDAPTVIHTVAVYGDDDFEGVVRAIRGIWKRPH
jgi:hypothetical protein